MDGIDSGCSGFLEDLLPSLKCLGIQKVLHFVDLIISLKRDAVVVFLTIYTPLSCLTNFHHPIREQKNNS